MPRSLTPASIVLFAGEAIFLPEGIGVNLLFTVRVILDVLAGGAIRTLTLKEDVRVLRPIRLLLAKGRG